MSATKKRYYVDDRVGCVAVRDRTKVNPDDNGLQAYYLCVVEFWAFDRVTTVCPTCGHTGSKWGDGKEQIVMAEKLAAELNEATNG